jgi:transcriptional regulator with XRE-family HTH domain
MTASNFKTALQTAGLTVEQFAEILEVDPKTVRRWAAGRLPYPRHRAAIARALDTTEHALWPDDVPAPPSAPDAQPMSPAPTAAVDGASTPSSDLDRPVCEVTAAWASPGAEGAPTVLSFLAPASRHVELMQAGNGIVRSPALIRSLRRCAANGAVVRLLVEKAWPELSELPHDSGIEVRIVDQRFIHGVVRADDRLLLALWLVGNSPTPVMQLERQVNDGVFDRVITHFETIWQAAEPLHGSGEAGHADGQPSHAAEGSSSARRWPRRSS